MDLKPDEEEIIRRYRKLAEEQKKAISTSQNSFKSWLQTSLSSIWNKISSFFNDVWYWFKDTVSSKGKFHRVWVEHNVTENNQKGMRIHAKFEVDNLKDVSCKIIAYFYYDSGGKLKDTNDRYCTIDGYVSASKGFTPSYKNSIYHDFELFMPNDELHMSDGKHKLKFCLALHDGSDFFADSSWYYFDYSKG